MPRKKSKPPTLRELAELGRAPGSSEETDPPDDDDENESGLDGADVEVDDGDGKVVVDEDGDNVVEEEGPALPPNPADKLNVMIRKYVGRWDTGFYYLDIYRDLPTLDAEGNRISGAIGRSSKPDVDEEWLRANFGGGTYRVYLKGPKQHKNGWRTADILGVVRGIVVGGAPFVNNRSPITPKSFERMDNPAGPAAGYGDKELIDRLLAQGRENSELLQRAVEEKAQAKSGEVQAAVTLMRDLNAQTNALVQGLMDRQGRGSPESLEMIRMMADTLKDRHDPSADARHDQALREAREQARDEVSRAREEAARERRELREQFDARERNLRDEWDRREQSVRKEYEAREQFLRSQLDEARDKARSLENKLESARRESIDARITATEASIRAAVAPGANGAPQGSVDEIERLVTTFERLKNASGALGLGGGAAAPVEDDSPIKQAIAILGTEPAKRVGAGIAQLLGNIGNRSAGYPQPNAAAVQQWQQARQGLPGASGGQVPQLQQPMTRRRSTVQRRDRSAPLDTAALPPGAPINPGISRSMDRPPVPEPAEDEVSIDLSQSDLAARAAAQAQQPAPTDSDQQAAAQLLLGEIEGAALGGKDPAAFLAELTPMLGGESVIALAKAQGADSVIEEIETTAQQRMSSAARELVRNALDG